MKFELVKFLTPKKLELFGFYIGKKNPETIYIFIHGLGSSVFRKAELYQKLAGKNSAVFAFNNRGKEIISRFSQVKEKGKYKSKTIGSAHEKFTDSLDDIGGAVQWVKKLKPKKIILVGHSTGCQKSIYYLSKKADKKVKAVVLLSPISDLAGVLNFSSKYQFEKAHKFAKKQVQNKKGDDLLPLSIWPIYINAQRFLSLYSQNSLEEIFCYSQESKRARILRKVEVPIYVLLGSDDKYLDRSPQQIIDWFLKQVNIKKFKAEIILKAGHSFKDYEKNVSKRIKNYF